MFYDRVQAWKTKHNVKTDKEFEALCGLRSGSIQYWKKGDPTFKTLQKISEATKTSIGYWVKS